MFDLENDKRYKELLEEEAKKTLYEYHESKPLKNYKSFKEALSLNHVHDDVVYIEKKAQRRYFEEKIQEKETDRKYWEFEALAAHKDKKVYTDKVVELTKELDEFKSKTFDYISKID